MRKTLRRLFLLLGSLLAVASLSGCFLMKGSRANIEKQFEVLGEIYPTQNVNDLRDKFPEGFTLYHKKYFGEIVYAVVIKGSSSQFLFGTFRVGKNDENSLSEETVLEVDITIDEAGNLMTKEPIPTEYKEQFHNFTFLFEELDLSKEEISQFDYHTHSSNANNGYFISYHLKRSELLKFFQDRLGDMRLTMEGNFDHERDYYDKTIELWTDREYIRERIQNKIKN